MKQRKTLLMLIFCTSLAWAGEAGVKVVGASKKPQLDLQATRKGDKVTLTWRRSAEIANLRICRSISSAPSDPSAVCAQTVGQVDLQKLPLPKERLVRARNNGAAKAQFVDTLPTVQQSAALQFAVYRLELRDSHGRSAGFSNAASVPLAPILPAKGFHFQLDVHGVYLIWENDIEGPPSSSFKFDYRLYRSEKGSPNRVAISFPRGVIHTKEGEKWTVVDANIEWEKTYFYSVTPVTRLYSQDEQPAGEIEGDESAQIQVTTHNVFPPAAPERLLVLITQRHGQRFLDLLWAPNVEKDISAYNVYRREENGEAVRINSVPMTMLSFEDTNVAAAHTYFYSISAVDKRGNESPRSQESAGVLH